MNTRAQNIKRNERGQTILVVVVFFMFISAAFAFGMVGPVIRDAQTSRNISFSGQSFFAAEAGIEDALYRLQQGMNIDDTETLSFADASVTINIVDTGVNEKQIQAVGDTLEHIRKINADVFVGSGVAFNFGVQAGNGGFIMKNNSTVSGNVYSNGLVSGENSNLIEGDIVSATASGTIDGIHATGTAYASTILNSYIEGDAHYDETITNTTVDGELFPGSTAQPAIDLPIGDDTIEEWKTDAETGGVISTPCPYVIDSDTTIGPVKIACDLEINGNNPEITLEGNVWVEGSITVSQSPVVRISPSLGNASLAVIADNPADNLTSGKISLLNFSEFYGTGTENSFILMVSQNNSDEMGGTESAIDINNNVVGDLLVYASHGRIVMENSADLREVTGHTIEIRNFTHISYKSGLASVLFKSGPGGTWNVESWKEVK